MSVFKVFNFVLFSPTIASIYSNMNSVSILNGKIFKEYKENVEIILDYMDLDLALRTEKPTSLTEYSTHE